jgi:hypothetical protein
MSRDKSSYFETIVEMAACGHLEWSATALTGRAITAYANSQEWMLRVGKFATDPLRLADFAEGFGEAVDDLLILWHRYQDESFDPSDFVVELERIVIRMERWLEQPA